MKPYKGWRLSVRIHMPASRRWLAEKAGLPITFEAATLGELTDMIDKSVLEVRRGNA